MRLGILLLILLSVFVTQSVQGRDKQTYAMSLKVFKVVEKANLLMDEEKHAEAVEMILERLSKKSNSKYEYAQLHYLLGSYYFRMKQEDKALGEFVKVLDYIGNIPELLHRQSLRTVAQMYMVQEDYDRAKDYLIDLTSLEGEKKASDFALLAQSFYKLESWQKAIDAALTSKRMTEEAGKVPKENLLLILNAIYFEMKAIEEMTQVLDLLILHYPKPSYIMYLASVYGQLGDTAKQTILIESLYDSDLIDEGSMQQNLATLYLAEKVPYKGAVVIEKALKEEKIKATERNYQLLSQAWRMAAEYDKAIIALEQAASLSKDGKLYLQTAYMLFERARFPDAQKIVNLAMDKGLEDEDLGEAWLLLGMVRFNLKQFGPAIAACERAKDYKDSRKFALQWINYIRSEEEKYIALTTG